MNGYHQRHQYEQRSRYSSPHHVPSRTSRGHSTRDCFSSRRQRSTSPVRRNTEHHKVEAPSFGRNTPPRRNYTRSPVRRSRSRPSERARHANVPYGRGRSRSRSRSRPHAVKAPLPNPCSHFAQEFSRPEQKKYSPPPRSPPFPVMRDQPFEQTPVKYQDRFPVPQVQYREVPEERDIERRILDPSLIRIVRREGEGLRPIFDRQEILAAPVDLREDCLRRVVAVVRPRWAPPSPPLHNASRPAPATSPCFRGQSPPFEPGGDLPCT